MAGVKEDEWRLSALVLVLAVMVLVYLGGIRAGWWPGL